MKHRGFSGIFSRETTLCDTVVVDMYHYKFVQTHKMYNSWASLESQMGKESTCNEGDLGSISGLRRFPGGEHGNPLQYYCLETPHGKRCMEGCSP